MIQCQKPTTKFPCAENLARSRTSTAIKEKLTINRLAMQQDNIAISTCMCMLSDYSCENLPCVAAIFEPLAHFVLLASSPTHWRDS